MRLYSTQNLVYGLLVFSCLPLFLQQERAGQREAADGQTPNTG
jgi:hypothetical protein